jgi:HAE1 family hydrophobic/amphiphilic exporter-1
LRARLNQTPAAALGVYLAPGANALQTADQIKRIVKERAEQFPPDMKYETTLDFTAPIKASLHEIEHTLIEAIILVLIVVYVFLQSFRATIIPMLTVPVSLLGAFIAFPLLGFSVNTLTLFGLVLAIGIVVDDAIVVVEAVQHHLEHGLSPHDATVKAMKEVSGPVIMIALILCAVFVPVAFMGCVTGQLYQQFAITVAVAVVFSAMCSKFSYKQSRSSRISPIRSGNSTFATRTATWCRSTRWWTSNKQAGRTSFRVSTSISLPRLWARQHRVTAQHRR